MPRGIIIAAALLASAGSADAQGRWETTVSGCKVWNDHPYPEATVTWSGACSDDGEVEGQGELVRSFVVDGHRFETRYRGRMRDGDMSGGGTVTLANGDRFRGVFHDGRMENRGTYSWASGDSYDGEFRNGQEHGRGVYEWANGDRFEGEFLNGLMNGRGEFVWANGDRYEGEFRNGTLDGEGLYIWASGRRLEGEFRQGRTVGYKADSGESAFGAGRSPAAIARESR
jgi:hypothetical protein